MLIKILCLGNNDTDTDTQVSCLALQHQTINHGLVTDLEFVPQLPGYYHTTILDITFGGIIQLSQHFDQVIMLDQPQSQWTHWKPLLTTYKVMVELEKQGITTVYRNNSNIQKYKLFDNIVIENKSFCIYPWIEMTEDEGVLTPCARSLKTVTTLAKLKSWKDDPDYNALRQKMLAGERIPDYCSVCYDYEDRGIESYRQFETKDWISKLDINSIDDLEKITHPYYYEVRLSNKCNIKCRSCCPQHSHLIAKEFKKFNIIYPGSLKDTIYSTLDHIDINTLSKKSRVYLTGGEPTIISDVYTFMQKCIDAGKTDYHLTMCTNGMKISDKFLSLANQFSDTNFSFSLDGFGQVNDYWRSGSDWDTIIKNAHLLESHGHTISINTVPGIYNVTNLHLLFEFLDREFPKSTIYLQINHLGPQSAFNHPYPELVLESMKRCKETKVYYSDGKSNKSCIDSLYNHYSKNPVCDLDSLREFFTYNDRLDEVRGVRLGDFIPELEASRLLLT
jgi:uncharacterized radical SAM superfamily Fe-S cluster-containing enzyme